MSAIDPSSIEACVFDAYGTLLDVNSAVASEVAELGPRAAELSALWRRKQLEYTWLRALMRRHADFREVTTAALDHALAALGLGEPDRRRRLLDAYTRLDPYPEVPAVLRALHRSGRPCAILSNGTPEMLAAGLEAAGIADLVDPVLSIESAGVFKPAPEVYNLATSRLGLPAGRILFLSSNGWDMHGAATYGLMSVWVNREAAAPEGLPGTPAAVMRSLAELPALLGVEAA